MLKPFDLVSPSTVQEAIAAAAEGGVLYAGGTDVLVMMHKGVEYPTLIDISRIQELKKLSYDEKKGLEIGACVTHTEIIESPIVNKYYPALVDGCSKIGSTQVRNKGTIGGNICNASPAADSAGPMMLYDAIVKICGPKGEREIPLEQFFTGVKRTVLGKGEMVTAVVLPPVTKEEGSAYRKLMKRGAMEIGIMSAGVRVICENGICKDARITLSAVAPTPIRVREAEAALVGKAVTEETILSAAGYAYEAATPKTWRNSEKWSKDMVKVYVPEAARLAVTRMKG